MPTRSRRERQHKRTMAVALVLSALAHGVILAYASFSVPLFHGGRDGARAAVDVGDRYLVQRPLQVVELRESAARSAAGEPRTADEPRAADVPGRLADAALRPRPAATAPPISLEKAETRTEGTPVVELLAAASGASSGLSSDFGEGVDFRGASAAAREAERGRGDRGGRQGRGGFGGGIIIVGGAGGDCDTGPATGIFDRFAGSYGLGGTPAGVPGGVPGRRF